MPKKRLSVQKTREILRLRFECKLSERKIATSCGIARSTVSDYLRRAAEAGIEWPLASEVKERDLAKLLFPSQPSVRPRHPLPQWSYVRAELTRPGVTLMILWEEYRSQHGHGYSYSHYCELYGAWRSKIDPVMRIEHKAGDKLFVDYAGQTATVFDSATGEERQAQIFVATMGASSYTYAEATWTQALPDWIGAHTRAFVFFGGVPRLLVPDNLKSGVTSACYYEPGINETYARMAEHYGIAVLPARVRRPKDKAKVESGVHVVETRILAKIRNRTFFSLAELNLAIEELLEELNNRAFQKMSGSRRSLFEEIDAPALRPLPGTAYVYAEWKTVRAGMNYHVSVNKHQYSVPYAYIKKKLDVCISDRTVEIFYKEGRIASHQRSMRESGYTTVRDHMPANHRQYAEWSPERIIRWAEKTGEATAAFVEKLMESRPYPEHSYRACMGVMKLGKVHSHERLEAACRRAIAIGAYRYKSIKSILDNGLDHLPLPETETRREPILHANIRGSDYYR